MKTLELVGMKSRQIRQGLINRNQTVKLEDKEALGLLAQNSKGSIIWKEVKVKKEA